MDAKNTTILVVDDEPRLLKWVAYNLASEGYAVLTATDGQQALDLLQVHQPDLVLLNLLMSQLDGFTLCQAMRHCSAVPIIIVTARGQDQDKVRGFDLGADDYLTTPFSVEELLARIEAVLRRAQVTATDDAHVFQTTTSIGPLTLDGARCHITLAGREIVLSPLEYRLLFYLGHHAGCTVTQEQLLEHVWGEEYDGEGQLLSVTMRRLSRKLEPDPAHPRALLAKPGIGYLLTNAAEASTSQ